MDKKDYNKSLFSKMLGVYLVLVLVVGGGMLWATLRTQVAQGKMWREKAHDREQITRSDPARRGTIFSSDGKVLATTVPVCDLCIDLGRWPKKDSRGNTVMKDGKPVMESCIPNDSAWMANLPVVCQRLHEQFPAKSVEYYMNRIMKERMDDKPSHCLVVERKVPYSLWAQLRALPGWGKCVVTKTSEGSVQSYVRAHIYGNLGENTIGLHYSIPTAEGYTGLEGYYDSVLRGQDGQYICRRLTRGMWLPMENGNIPDEDSTLVQRRIDGKDIVATLDTRYQDIAESALRSSMNKFGGQRGCAILMETETGYILACSNLTRDTSGRLSEMLWSNVACSDIYEPGSTFKTVAMTAMFNDKKTPIDTAKRVRAGGVKTYSAHSGEINDGHGYATDTANLAGVLARSSNIGMCELAWEYYRDRRLDLKKGIEEVFPFGILNLDLAVKEYPTKVVDDHHLKSDRDFLNLSYGYSATVSPLQLVTFYNALANGGRMVKPLFCRAVKDEKRQREIKPVVLKEKICSAETAKQMREMLVKVVESGTGDIIYNPVYGIGGKTGTTQGIHDKSLKNSSFVGFFPADKPRYTCLVLVEQTSIAGRHAAAPVFKKIADCVVALDKNLGSIRMTDSTYSATPTIAKGDLPQVRRIYKLLGINFMADSTAKGEWTRFDGDRNRYVGYEMPEGVVPDCKGMTIRDALTLLRGMGLEVRYKGQGKVVSQTPKARTACKKGTIVYLELKN